MTERSARRKLAREEDRAVSRPCQLVAAPRSVGHTRVMKTSTSTDKHHRFPPEIISHAVWLYFRFCLSYRDVEELLFARGIIVTSEAIRQWCRKFGQAYANHLRHRRPQPGDKWHLDEVFLTIRAQRHYLWRAVDQDGHVSDILVQRRRNKAAAEKFFRKPPKGLTESTRDRYGYVEKLWCYQARAPIHCGTSAAPLPQQSGGPIAIMWK